MSRPTAEQRRRDYLAIGAELAAEFDAAKAARSPIDALAHIRVADVARRAGVTKGALYHIWDSQEEYRRDLLAHLLELEKQAGFREAEEALGSIPPDLGTLEALDMLAQMSFDRLKDDPACYVRFSFVPYARHPSIQRLLESGSADFSKYYEAWLTLTGRRMREPYTIEHLFRLTEAYLFGCLLRYRTSPELVQTAIPLEGRNRTLYTFGLAAIMRGLTELDPEAEPTG